VIVDFEALFAEADEVIEQSRQLTENCRTGSVEPKSRAKPDRSSRDLERQLAIALQQSLAEAV
jgi:hypothetical protein